MLKILTVALAIPMMLLHTAQAEELQSNDLLSAYVDNDADFESYQENLDKNPNFRPKPLSSNGNGLSEVNAPAIFLSFEQVMANLSPLLEQKFDMFILANTAETGASSDMVRFQHLRVLKKKTSDLPVFVRDRNGRITGFQVASLEEIPGLPEQIPTSTGRSGVGIRTFSGIFRVNERRSRTNLSTSSEAPMSHQTYIDFVYDDGKESGVAIHGTPARFRNLLGIQRASHGCMRTDPANARLLRAAWYNVPEMNSDDLPAFNRRHTLPSADVQNGTSGQSAGPKVLVIIFNGYQNQALDAKAAPVGKTKRGLSSK